MDRRKYCSRDSHEQLMSTILLHSRPLAPELDHEALHRRLEQAWKLNEALGAELEAGLLAEPEAARVLAEDFARRRRILYVHMQANRLEHLLERPRK